MRQAGSGVDHDRMNADTVQIRRWRRFGNDRLYISAAGGTDLGFWDVATSRAHPIAPEYERAVIDAAVDWLADQLRAGPDAAAPVAPAVVPVDPAVVSVDPAVVPVDPAVVPVDPAVVSVDPAPRPWRDLAANEAGASAREQAHAARDAAPIRTFFARALGVHNDERAWRIGADGEQKVAAQLARLGQQDPRWRFIHAIPVGSRGADIDHVVIGPGGVFTVNAKHHPRAQIWVGGKTFLVNGTQQPYLRNSRYEAQRAARLLTAATGLDLHVGGLIAVVNAGDLVVKNTPRRGARRRPAAAGTWLAGAR